MTYGLSLNSQQSWWIWCLCDVEKKIIKVERIQQFSTVPSEPPLIIQEFRPPQTWPAQGMIVLQNLQVGEVKSMSLGHMNSAILFFYSYLQKLCVKFLFANGVVHTNSSSLFCFVNFLNL